MATYRIEYPDGTSETTKSRHKVTHAVVIQGKHGEAWATWEGYPNLGEAYGEAAYLAAYSKMHAVQVVPVTTA